MSLTVNNSCLVTKESVPEGYSSGFLSRASAVCSSLFDQAKSKNSYIVFGVVGLVGVGVLGYHLYSQYKTTDLPLKNEGLQTVDDLVDTCENLVENRQFEEAKEAVQKFAEQFVERNLDAVCCQKSGKDYLSERMAKILIDMDIRPESKKQIMRTVLEDFIHLFAETKQRAEADVEAGNLRELNIESRSTLKEIHCLGDETHHQGRIPMLLVFEDGTRVVYKPRSMQPEQLICGKEESVFAAAGLGTYTVLLREDENGEYGYCEYLYNHKSENTMDSVEEVEAYYKQLYVIEKICRKLGCADLHYGNAITAKKNVHLIDLEVYSNPKGTDTLIFASDSGIAVTFDMTGGTCPDKKGKNKIWFASHLTENHGVNFRYYADKEDLRKIGVDLDTLEQKVEELSFSEEERQSIHAAKETLKSIPGRYILENTANLKSMLAGCDPNDENTLTPCVAQLRDCLEKKGFQLAEGCEEHIIGSVKEDALHHDIPVFYYDSVNKTVLYHGEVIGVAAQ